MAGLADLVVLAKEYGIFEFYLPFVILFSLMYGLLSKSKIFGDPKEVKKAASLNAIISLAAAFYVMAYSPLGVTLTEFFANFFTQTAVILVTLLAFLMIIGLLVPISGREPGEIFKGVAKYVVIFGALIGIGMFISSGGLNIFPGLEESTLPGISASSEDLFIIILLVLTAIVVWWVSKGEGKSEEKVKYVGVPIREKNFVY